MTRHMTCWKMESKPQYLYLPTLCMFGTEDLQQQAGVFRRNARDLKSKMWWKDMKVKAVNVTYVTKQCSVLLTA